MITRLPYWIIVFILNLTVQAQIPAGYYSAAANLSGDELRDALKTIISSQHTRLSYSAVWTAYQVTDTRPEPNNTIIWDMYSDIPNGTPAYQFTVGVNQCGTASAEGDCYSREHSFPSSWWGGSSSSTAFQYTDLHHLFPADQYVNLKKSNFPLGNVTTTATPWISTNGSKVGICAAPEYAGKVFEPIDEYKGDFARAYLYMITRYKDLIPVWTQNYPTQALAQITEGDNYKLWYVNMLISWHLNDPVSTKEINRNNAIYYQTNQGNRNPYIDHPEFILEVWGSLNFTVPPPLALLPEQVLWNDFSARWQLDEDTPEIDGFYLDLSTSSSFNQVIPNIPTDLFFSEYVEGSSSNKYMEIYNGTENFIDLSDYRVQLYANGSSTPTTINTLSGLLGPEETLVLRNSAATFFSGESIVASTMNFNGNDALALFKISTNSFVDLFGRIGEDPGVAWSSGNHTTLDRTLVRTATVKKGITQNPAAGFPTLVTEWEVFPMDTVDNLDVHVFATEIVVPDLLSNYNNFLISNSNTTQWEVTGLEMNTDYFYRVRSKAGNLKSVSSNTQSLKTRKGAFWTSTGWLNNVTPDTVTDAIMDADYQTGLAGGFEAKSLWIRNGAFILSSETLVTLEEGIHNLGNSDQLVLESNSNLIQSQPISNTGIVTVQRTSSALKRLDYTLWSSPVQNQNLKNFSPQTLNNRFYTYNTQTNFYNAINPDVHDFETARGYLIRIPNNHPTQPTPWLGTFRGVLNNGDYQIELPQVETTYGYHLVGNPYPSPIQAKTFVQQNTDITGVLYFYRKTNNLNQATNPTPTYCVWSPAGGLEGTFVSNGEAEVNDPQGVIQTGQGFFVQTFASGGVLNFSNEMRVSNFSNQFFRSHVIDSENTYSRIWFDLKGSQGRYSQMVIGYFYGATDGFDPGWDALYFNDGDIALTSVVEGKLVSIDARGNHFTTQDYFPLHININQAGQYEISLHQFDGIFSNADIPIYLVDAEGMIYHNLRNSPYIFYSEAGQFEHRFELRFQNEQLLLPEHNPTPFTCFYKDNTIHIQLPDSNSYLIELVDLFGRTMNQWNSNFQTTMELPVQQLPTQVYFIKVIDNQGRRFQKKLLIQK